MNGYDFGERPLNQLGYMLLGRDRNADAVKFFQLNVEEYPKSGNVYDSLAEAYEKSGQKLLAVENYRKAFALDPNNRRAKDKVKELAP
jgi:Tfp pilus assembly protein PilF